MERSNIFNRVKTVALQFSVAGARWDPADDGWSAPYIDNGQVTLATIYDP